MHQEDNLDTKKGATAPAVAPKPRKPRAKKEQGGSAQLPFVVERIEHGDVTPTAIRKTGGGPSLKHASGNQPPAIYGGAKPAPAKVSGPRKENVFR